MSAGRTVAEKIVAILLLLLFAPLMAVIAILIRLDSPGPVIFRQTRIGLNEKPFVMFKFRTMKVGVEARHKELLVQQVADGGSFFLYEEKKSATTRAGRILRKLSLDELPQFANVLLGTMSLVGPRPMTPGEIEHLSENQKRRFLVPPGITGLTQISGRGLLSPTDYVAFDLQYVDNYSPFLYWRIIVMTPMSILTTRGAN